MKTHFTIEEVAKQTGLTAYTLRYYERIGLIAAVGRSTSGQRRYAASDMAWIAFLLRLRTTQMPIGMMQTFATLRSRGDATIPARRQLLENHLQNTLANLEAMRQSAHELEVKIGHYKSIEQSTGHNGTSCAA
jgi:DNA-binding transcriptional MerR regulator